MKLVKLGEKWLWPALLAIGLIVIWEVSCRLFEIKEYLLPPPSRILEEVADNFNSLMVHASVTLLEALLGFLIANSFAVLAAILMVSVKALERAIMPFAIALKTTPIVAMAPLLLLWLGNGIALKVASAAVICFFPALVNSLRGLNSLEEGEEELFRVYGATKGTMLFKLRLWRAAPFVFSGLKASSSLAVVGAIVGEFVGANRGIGYVILVSSYHLETARMFAALFLGAIAGLTLYGILSVADSKLIYWQAGDVEDPRSDRKVGVRKPKLA